MLQQLDILPVKRGPNLNRVLEEHSTGKTIQRDNHLPSPAGHTISDVGQDATGLLGHLGTLLLFSWLLTSIPGSSSTGLPSTLPPACTIAHDCYDPRGAPDMLHAVKSDVAHHSSLSKFLCSLSTLKQIDSNT